MPTSKQTQSAGPVKAGPPNDELDTEIAEDLAERQQLDLAGRGSLGQRQRDHASASPKLAGGDVDAAWDDETGDGEELVGGDNPTPDQDRVDDIGEGAGLTYEDDEPLNFEKVLVRDQHRWELNAASAADAGDEELALEVEDDEEDDLDELGLTDGEGDGLEVLDVDDLADDEDEAEEVEEADLENVDELEDDDSTGPDDDEEEDDEDDDDDDEDDDDDDF